MVQNFNGKINHLSQDKREEASARENENGEFFLEKIGRLLMVLARLFGAR